MLKAVFIDYTGTTVMEGGQKMKEAVKRICTGSNVHDPKEVMRIWWGILRKYEENCYKEAYITEDEILDKAFGELVRDYGLEDNVEELKELVRGFWVNAPIFPDTKEFYDNCPLPLYVITNNSVQYDEKAMAKNELRPTGIVCADMVNAYKPHRELFQKALEFAGCKPEEAIHIGDSYSSDVLGARTVGIKPILVQRNDDTQYEDEELITVRSLAEILDLLR